jgi:hypothetical protein
MHLKQDKTALENNAPVWVLSKESSIASKARFFK